MLNSASLRCARTAASQQRGVVLMIALIMLVAMTLGGIALIRAVYSSSLIAGNMAFQQSATSSADAGIEAGISWLENNNSSTMLHANSAENAYTAYCQPPCSSQDWGDYWDALQEAQQTVTLASADAAGNTVSYAIQRLCNGLGDPSAGADCAVAPMGMNPSGSSKGGGVVQIQYSSQVYDRVTARVAGARGSVSFVQVVLLL